jgi:hypothetical protein
MPFLLHIYHTGAWLAIELEGFSDPPLGSIGRYLAATTGRRKPWAN